MLNLDFSGTVVVHALYINGVQQPVRQYNEVNLSAFITGAGSLKPLMGNAAGGILVIR
jgi:hypothetical protein